MAKPGEIYDRFGVPIYPGDLLKTYHFTGRRKKRYWLYHFAGLEDGVERMFVYHVEQVARRLVLSRMTWVESLGWYDEAASALRQTEVIAGHGPHKDWLGFEDRPRKKLPKQEVESP